jgi:hypothetical protein
LVCEKLSLTHQQDTPTREMGESGDSESELVGSGNSSSQAKDEVLNFIQSLPEGQRLAAFTKYMEENTKQERERANQEQAQQRKIELLEVKDRPAALADQERTKLASVRERTKLEKERTEQARERTKQMHLQV